MDFELTADQLALRDAARDLLDRMASPERVRKVVDAGGGYDAELWSAMVDQGWTRSPEFVGQSSRPRSCSRRSGRHVAPAPFLTQWLAGGGDEHHGGGLGPRRAGALCPVGRRARSPGRGDDMRTGRDRRHAAARGAGHGPDARGRLAAHHRLGEGRGRRATPTSFLDRAAVAFSAEMLGLSAKAMEMSVEYAKVREQFGKPIGSFQAVKHRCADMLVDVEGMRSAVYWAAWCVGAGDPDASIAASTAKAGAPTHRSGCWPPHSKSTAASASRGSTISTST